MTRNTLRRVEVASPVMDADIRARILAMFDTMLRDNMQAREMDCAGTVSPSHAGRERTAQQPGILFQAGV